MVTLVNGISAPYTIGYLPEVNYFPGRSSFSTADIFHPVS